MGGTIVKESAESESDKPENNQTGNNSHATTATATTTMSTSIMPPPPAASSNNRKHSTVSTARLLLYGDKDRDKFEFLSEEQKGHIRTCWKRIESDVASVGVITFIQLFETHPEVKQVFLPFNGLRSDELKANKQLRAHALRVMGFVEKAVARLDEKDKLDKLLEDLGKAHFYYGAPKKYIDLIGPQLIKTIEPSLQDIWCKEINDAWVQLFRYIAYHMKEALSAAEKAKRGSK